MPVHLLLLPQLPFFSCSLSFSSFFPPFPSSSLSSSSSSSSTCPHPHPTSVLSSTIPFASLLSHPRVPRVLPSCLRVTGSTYAPPFDYLPFFFPSFLPFVFYASLARKFIAENFPVSPAARVQQDLLDRAETTELFYAYAIKYC